MTIEAVRPDEAAGRTPGPGVRPGLGQHAAAPLLDALRTYRSMGTRSWHCPGHKGGEGADAALVATIGADALRSDAWLDTGSYDRLRRAAEDLMADAWGADRAFVLVNGSSGGNHALLLSLLAPGDEVVVSRDAHTSTWTGLVLSGARPVWVSPRESSCSGLGAAVDAHDLDRALRAHPSARAAVIVSPTYWGQAADVAACAAVAHAHGVPLVVDEAWGAHLRFHPALPVDAMSAGADAAVVSLHKMGTALSQAAVVLVRDSGRIDVERVGAAVRMTQTTSPLLPVVASADATRRQLVEDGETLLGRAMTVAAALRQRIDLVPGLRVVAGGERSRRRDPLKVVVDVSATGRTGLALDRLLRERHAVAVEGSDTTRLLLVVGPGETGAHVGAVVRALADVASADARTSAVPVPRTALELPSASRRPAPAPAPPEVVLTPRESWHAATERVDLDAAIGRIAAEPVTPYPPGVPLLAAGERVTGDLVAVLRHLTDLGTHLHGCADPELRTLRVVVAGPTAGTVDGPLRGPLHGH